MAARRGRWQRDQAKERHWRRMVRKWRSSGLSVREFCDWQALSEPCFYAWRRELAKRDREATATVASGGATVAGRTQRNGSGLAPLPAFVPVRVVADGAAVESVRPSRPDGIELQLPGGVRLLVPPGCDRALLRDLIACCAGMGLETRPC
jgi:hypothetical protein